MSSRVKKGRRRLGATVAGAVVGAVAMGVSVLPAGATVALASGTEATFTFGILTVTGDGQDNTIRISRDAAGTILVNGGTVPVTGGVPTVANTRQMTMIGAAGNDTLTVDETNGALPKANLIGGSGNDVLTGGSSGDILIGQAGNDVLLGKGGTDLLLGGTDDDTVTGGDADDQAFGDAGNDKLIWNPGDDTDLNEGGDGFDITEVNGGNGQESFTETANGARVRFDRLDPAPFSIDIGTTETLVLHANGGDDSFSATGNLAALIGTVVDGGDGNDTLLGSNGADLFYGGPGQDFVDGQQGNDFAYLGDADDTFQWDPGDGSDTVEGQAGHDTLVFNGSNASENMDVSANGSRARLFRNVGSITMDTDDVETFAIRALGGVDNVVVNDMTGTDVTEVTTDLAATGGGDDGSPDNVTVAGTNGDDVAVLSGQPGNLQVAGLSTAISVLNATATNDIVTVLALAGDDVVDASGVATGSAGLVLNGGDGDDVLIGGDGNDTILGEAGDDVLLGGPGSDVLDGGPGDNVLIQGENLVAGVAAGDEWLANHVHEVNGSTVLDFEGNSYRVPAADLLP